MRITNVTCTMCLCFVAWMYPGWPTLLYAVGSFESNCRTLYVGGLRKKDGWVVVGVSVRVFWGDGGCECVSGVEKVSVSE